MESKRGQLTIFVIIAIIIIGGIIAYFALRDKTVSYAELPAEFQQVEQNYLNCIEQIVRDGVDLMGTQGGYIDPPEYEAGSDFMPFSSQLNFFGYKVPYWYYKTGNNIIKEQVPTRKKLEENLGLYVLESVDKCAFAGYEMQGFSILQDAADNVEVSIRSKDIAVRVEGDLIISKGNDSYRVDRHDVDVDTKFGKFYDLAINIYDYEKNNMFLEEYAVDALRLYAPVDGFEITCSPKIWMFRDVVDELRNAISANMQAIKLRGDYYKGADKYFVENLDSSEAVNFMYMPDWPTKVEVWPSENEVMVAEPVGNQDGLGILGFCYVPWHFVYDLSYPVLVQIYDNQELFQFPISVIIDKNVPREALPATAVEDATTDFCKYKNTKIDVYTYDVDLNPVEAMINFKCISDTCSMGTTSISGYDARLSTDFPQCINGIIVAKADGYADAKYEVSTNERRVVDILMNKLYELDVDLKLDGIDSQRSAVIYFKSDTYSTTVAWPQQKKITLAEGYYNVSVYVYRNSTLKIEGTKTQKCTDVPREGLLGIFGLTTEKCFDINIPDQTIEMSLAGGGKSEDYILDTELRENSVLEISADSLPTPDTLEQLQDNYALFEYNDVYLAFR